MTGVLGSARDPGTSADLEADVVVCGGGAGGSMAARELARAGARVLLLEEGPDQLPGSFTQREEEMIPRLFQRMGGLRTADLAILVLAGRGLGGSTVHNLNLCRRAPDEVLHHWSGGLGVEGWSPEDLHPLYAEVERDLGVAPIPEERVNALNALFRAGVERLGYRGALMSHNRDDRCIGSGFCELGCAYDAKLNARRVLVPQALAAGAEVRVDARVVRILNDGRRATGVEAEAAGPDGVPGPRFRVRCRAVALGASAIGSAALALASRLPDPHGQIGRGLRLHPAAVVAGVFDRPVEAWRGVPQSYECTEFLDFREGSDRRVWIVPSFAHPAGTAALVPGFGPSLAARMRDYPRMAALVAMVHDGTAGRVEVDRRGRARIVYVPDDADREQLALGAREAARILLAAGAREVLVPALPPIPVRREADLAAITAARFRPHDARISAVHPMGSLRMGPDARTSATDPRGRLHGLAGVRVVDGSLFPTSIGVPPQISIYTAALRVARDLAGELGRA